MPKMRSAMLVLLALPAACLVLAVAATMWAHRSARVSMLDDLESHRCVLGFPHPDYPEAAIRNVVRDAHGSIAGQVFDGDSLVMTTVLQPDGVLALESAPDVSLLSVHLYEFYEMFSHSDGSFFGMSAPTYNLCGSYLDGGCETDRPPLPPCAPRHEVILDLVALRRPGSDQEGVDTDRRLGEPPTEGTFFGAGGGLVIQYEIRGRTGSKVVSAPLVSLQ